MTPSTSAAGGDAGSWAGYPGSKGGAGVAERIAGLLPPHRIYVEPFLGHGAVMRRKTPADWNIGLDLDPNIVRRWKRAGFPGVVVARGNAFVFLERCIDTLGPDAVVYVDPPYLRDSRTRLLYECELPDPHQHQRLIYICQQLRCNVVMSHYPHPLYDQLLAGWRRVTFKAMTRGGVRVEAAYCNFPEPATFHDPLLAHVGHRQRLRVKRKRQRWVDRFRRMAPAERQLIAQALAEAQAAPGDNAGADAGGRADVTTAAADAEAFHATTDAEGPGPLFSHG